AQEALTRPDGARRLRVAERLQRANPVPVRDVWPIAPHVLLLRRRQRVPLSDDRVDVDVPGAAALERPRQIDRRANQPGLRVAFVDVLDQREPVDEFLRRAVLVAERSCPRLTLLETEDQHDLALE